jgi:hypothetical protein
LLIAGAALSDGRLAFEKSSKADRMSDDSD